MICSSFNVNLTLNGQGSMSAILKFCPDCNNLLTPKEERVKGVSGSHFLVYTCRSCPHVERADMEALEDLIVYRRDVHFTQKEKLMIRPDVIHDPTLSRTEVFECHHCPSNVAVFWQLPESQQEDAMALIFVCTGCKNWRLEGKKQD